jgi:hypothetical protein
MSKALATITGLSPLWLAAALGVVALTIAVHALARTRARRVVFPGQRFLQEVAHGARRRSRPRNLLLLALRALMLASLALAFGQPGWATSSRRSMPGDVVIVVDASASMSRLVHGRSLFDRAKQRALRMLDDAATDGASVGVVIAAVEARSLLPVTTNNVAALREQLRALGVTGERAGLAQAIDAARALPALEPGAPRRIVVVSDMQASGFDEASLESFPDVEWIDVGEGAATTSLAIVGMTATPEVAAPGERVVVTVDVARFGGAASSAAVLLEIDSATIDKRGVPFGDSGLASARFEINAPDAPVTTLRARLVGRDALDADDSRYTAIVRAETVDATIISRSIPPLVRAALAPDDERSVVTRPPSEASVAGAEPSIVVADAGTLNEGTLDALGARLRGGARVVWILDDAGALASFDAFTAQNRLAPASDSPFDAETARFIAESLARGASIERFTLGNGFLAIVRGFVADQLAVTGALPVLLHALLLDASVAAPPIAHVHIGEGAVIRASGLATSEASREYDESGSALLRIAGASTPDVRAITGESGDVVGVVVTNIDPRESDLATSAPIGDASVAPVAGSEVTVVDVTPLWPALLALAFLCLCFEPLAGGRRRL